MISLLKVILWAFVAVAIYATVSLWKTGRHPWEIPPPPKTDKQIIEETTVVANEEEVEYLAAIIRHSFRGGDLERLLVALAAKNTKELLNTDYQTVFRKAAEMVPPWSAKAAYIRVRMVVMALGTEGEVAKARSLARQMITNKYQEPYASLLQALPSSQRCVTTYFRPEGNKNPQSEADLSLMRAWEPKAHTAQDGAFWLCLPKHKPAKAP